MNLANCVYCSNESLATITHPLELALVRVVYSCERGVDSRRSVCWFFRNQNNHLPVNGKHMCSICLLIVCRCKGSDVCEARTVCLTLNDSFVVNRNAIVIVFFDRMALRFPCRCARFDICRWRTDTSRRVVHIRNVPRLSQSLYNDVLQPWQSINSQLASQIYSCLMLCELFVVPIKLCALENRSLFLSSFSANLCIVCNYWFHFSDDADFRKWN